MHNGQRFKLEVYPDLSASQTFDEQSYRRKTLHAQTDLHNHAVIVKANAANFSMTVPLFDQSKLQKELELSSSYTDGQAPSFDLYIESDSLIYKLEKCVFETTTFNIGRNDIITATLTGSASRIVRVSSIPGVLQPTPSREFTKVDLICATIDASTLTSVVNVNIEVSNNIEWIKNDTLHETTLNNTVYPANFVMTGREVKGSFTHYLTSENEAQLTNFSTILPIELNVNSNLLVFELPSAVFTRREEFGDVFTRTYDFRLNTNSETVKPIYKGV